MFAAVMKIFMFLEFSHLSVGYFLTREPRSEMTRMERGDKFKAWEDVSEPVSGFRNAYFQLASP